MSQIIPDTDNVEVAKIAAALHLAGKIHDGGGPDVAWLDDFKKAYRVVAEMAGGEQPPTNS